MIRGATAARRPAARLAARPDRGARRRGRRGRGGPRVGRGVLHRPAEHPRHRSTRTCCSARRPRRRASSSTRSSSPRRPTGALGAGDIRLALLYENGLAQSARGAATAPPLGAEELAVARGERRSSVRTATDGRVQYRVVAVDAGEGRALVIGQRLDATRAGADPARRRAARDRRVGVALAALAGVGGGPDRPAAGAAADRGDRAGRARPVSCGPIPVDGSDELARLTASFNDMLGALAASQEQQRRLVADAGHELRTPLTSMRTNLELLAAAARPGAPAAARVGPRRDPRRPAGADRGAVDAGRRPGRAGTGGRPAGRARAGGADRRRVASPRAGPAAGRGRRVHRDARCRGR